MHCKLTDENHTRGWYLMGYNYRYFCFKQKSFQPWLIMRIHDCSIHFGHRDLANKTLMYAVAWTSATSFPHSSLLKPPSLKPELFYWWCIHTCQCSHLNTSISTLHRQAPARAKLLSVALLSLLWTTGEIITVPSNRAELVSQLTRHWYRQCTRMAWGNTILVITELKHCARMWYPSIPVNSLVFSYN